MALVSAEGKKLTKSLPLQASVGNMVRRILKIIREEYVATQQVRNATEMHAVKFRLFLNVEVFLEQPSDH